jgi:hypothetical protein
MSRLLLVLAALEAIQPIPSALAQAEKPGAAAELDVLPGLPRPPDAPSSLLQPPPLTKPYTCEPLAGPYFERDPRLDPPSLPPPGWFADIEIGIVGTHVKNRLTDTVVVGDRAPDTVHVPGADLGWTVAPRVELGYRLPSGFGEFAFAYRFFATDGAGIVAGPDAPAAVKSRLSVNIVDVDYASREFFTAQCPYCRMKWHCGIRYADVFFDSRSVEPFAAAAAGSGVFETSASNNFWGVGPHAGLELSCPYEQAGFALVASVDGATLLGRIRQNFSEVSTSLGPTGQLLTGATRESVSQSVPVINAFVGVRWQPLQYPLLHVDAGYMYEYWWNIGRDSGTSSRGELSDQGVLLRAEINF